jgi:pilus assembly protein Flp/PilA
MRNLIRVVARWLSLDSKRGVTALKYGLIASLIALGLIAGVTLTGTKLKAVFNYIAPKVAVSSGEHGGGDR